MESKNTPMRRCVTCMTSRPQKEMTRVVFYDKQLKIDIHGNENGRGAYVCNNVQCIENIKKRKAYQRSFKTQFPETTIDEITQMLFEVVK